MPDDASALRVRDRRSHDTERVRQILRESWASYDVVVRGRVRRADTLPALVAERDGGLVGLLTYEVGPEGWEVVTLDAVEPGRGIGGALLAAAVTRARALGCRRLWLVTTNDNLDALRFYQRRGLRLVAVYPGAVDAARRLKPAIPRVGAYGIPLHDELELALPLGGGAG